ncbi:hypothetical protein ABKN59_004325 [Abortiporus biennis]
MLDSSMFCNPTVLDQKRMRTKRKLYLLFPALRCQLWCTCTTNLPYPQNIRRKHDCSGPGPHRTFVCVIATTPQAPVSPADHTRSKNLVHAYLFSLHPDHISNTCICPVAADLESKPTGPYMQNLSTIESPHTS